MINIEKQIEYWQSGSQNDFETAQILLENKKYIHGLFFCHLSVEKIIKALIVKNSGEIPPKSHDLFYLSKLAAIELPEEQEQTAQILMKYQLEGRYPEYYPKTPDLMQINHHFVQTKELLTWFRKKL
jgi:HEPN domain-containing protein